MAKTSFAKTLIETYKNIINILYDKKIIIDYNELSEKDVGHKKIIEFCTKDNSSQCLMDPSIIATDLYSQLYSHRQFNIEFVDGSILLFQCTIEGKKIIKQRMVFIKIYESLPQEDVESWEAYQVSDAEKTQLSFPILLRTDYNFNENKEYHPISHLTISNIENCRIPIKANLGFDRFIEFVLHQFFHRFDIPIPKMNYDITIKDVERKKVHVNWEN